MRTDRALSGYVIADCLMRARQSKPPVNYRYLIVEIEGVVICLVYTIF